jgi:hypothetical protein
MASPLAFASPSRTPEAAQAWAGAFAALDALEARTHAKAGEQAKRCARRAQEALERGDKARALHWLGRAQTWQAYARTVL